MSTNDLESDAGAPIGRELRRVRRNSRVSVVCMAELLRVSESTIYAWESGRRLPNARDVIAWRHVCKNVRRSLRRLAGGNGRATPDGD